MSRPSGSRRERARGGVLAVEMGSRAIAGDQRCCEASERVQIGGGGELLRTSERGTRGGPEAMSAAFVPGRIRRAAPVSSPCSWPTSCASASDNVLGDGEIGGSWTSGNGGGEGRRGELEGDAGAGATDAIVS
jgi:hypothetical protein